MSQLFRSTVHNEEIVDLVQRMPQYDERKFWQERLRGCNGMPRLGRNCDDSAAQSIGLRQITIPQAAIDHVHALAVLNNLSRDTVYLAAWSILLGRYSGEERALFGVRFVSLQANHEQIWPLVIGLTGDAPVSSWLRECQSLRDDLSKRAPVTEKNLRQWCEVSADQSLLETVVDFTDNKISCPPRHLLVRISADGSTVSFSYCAASFTADAIERLANQYLCLIEDIANNSDKAVRMLNMVPSAQRFDLLERWNATERRYDTTLTLKQLFESKAIQSPGAIAAEYFSRDSAQLFALTYEELNARANQLAHWLQKAGVAPDTIVGVAMDRSLDMIIAVLAVIKAGAAYAALDPSYPADRIAFMVEDTKAPVILTQDKYRDRFAHARRLLCLDRQWEEISKEDVKNLLVRTSADNLAYIIYTSGSTGKPKGVAMRQGPLVNLLNWQLDSFSGPAAARTLQFASLNFDVSFQEIFSTWCAGGTLVLISEEERRDTTALAHFVTRNRIERIFLPFVALKHLADAFERENIYPPRLREIITAGEQLQISTSIQTLFTRLNNCTLENQYGPSETHVVTAYRLEGDPKTWPVLPSIGKPIYNTRIYLLDQDLQPVPIGVAGEIYIGGDCLARGYLNRDDLTAEKFIVNPFDNTSRLYKTGDLARWMPDGNIEFLGRIDHQVKIRGFRVELGEVEAILSKHERIKEAVVTAHSAPDTGDKRLVAYVISKNGPIASAEIRQYLQKHLPPYCIPSAFVTLSSLPLTPSGKVDRRALPEPTVIEEQSTTIKSPRDSLELQLKLVFEKFLQRRPIGIDVSFFELGGDSLQALKLIVEVERATGKKIELNVLYQAATVEALAKAIRERSSDASFSSLVPLQRNGTKCPLFLVHTTPGDVLGYGNLVHHLDSNRPCFGFQSLGFADPALSHTSIEEMAAYYIKLLRGQQPNGPYFLGGWCYGGIVAVEMANQLRDAGQSVGPLILIETPAPTPSFANMRYYVRRVCCLLRMTPRQWSKYLQAKYRYYSGRRQADEMRFRRVDDSKGPDLSAIQQQNDLLAKLERVYHTNLNAWHGYKPRDYHGKIVLFNAAEPDPAVVRDPKYGWPALAKKLETHFIPGNHDTILMEPHVRILAERINQCLNSAEQLPQNQK